MLDLNIGICSFKELIEGAFGDQDNNVVNFKVIQTVLYLLARQLGVLDRLVQVDFVSERQPSKSLSSITVSEIKIQATSANKKIKPKDVNEKAIRRTEDLDRNKTRTSVNEATSIQSQSYDLKTKFITQGWPYNPSLDDVKKKVNVNERLNDLQENKNLNHTKEMLHTDRTKTRTDDKMDSTTNAYVTEKSSTYQAITYKSLEGKLTKTVKDNNINLHTLGEKPSESRPEKRKINASLDDIKQPYQRSSLEESQREEPESEEKTTKSRPKVEGVEDGPTLYQKEYYFPSGDLMAHIEKNRLSDEYRRADSLYSDEIISRNNSHSKEIFKYEGVSYRSYNIISASGAEGINGKEPTFQNEGYNSGGIRDINKVNAMSGENPGTAKLNRKHISCNAGVAQSQTNVPVTFQNQENYSLNVQEMSKFERQKQALLSKSPGYEYKEISTKKEEEPYGKFGNFLLSQSNEKENLQKEKKDLFPRNKVIEDPFFNTDKEYEDNTYFRKEKKNNSHKLKSLKEDFKSYIGSLEDIVSINKNGGQFYRNIDTSYHKSSYEDDNYGTEKINHRFFKNERSDSNNTNEKNDHRYEISRYRSASEDKYLKKSRPIADKFTDSRQLPFERQNYHSFSERDTYDRSDRKPIQRSTSEEVISKVESFKEQNSHPHERKTTFDFTKYIKLNKTSSEEVISKMEQEKNKSGHKSNRQIKDVKETEVIQEIPETKKRHDHSISKPLYRTSSEEIYKKVKEEKDAEEKLGYEIDEQVTRDSKPRKRKNSKYEQFYLSSSDEFIEKQIKDQSEKVRSKNKSDDQSSQGMPFKRDGSPETPINYQKQRTDQVYLDSMIKKEKSDRHHGKIRYDSLPEENKSKKNYAHDNSEIRKLGKKESDALTSSDDMATKNTIDNIFISDYNRENKNSYDYAKSQPRIKINDNDTKVEQRSQNYNKYSQEQPTNRDIKKPFFDAFNENVSKLEKLRQAIMSKCSRKGNVEPNYEQRTSNVSDKEEKTYKSLKDTFFAKSHGQSRDNTGREINYRDNTSDSKKHDNLKDGSSLNQNNLVKSGVYNESSKKQPREKAEFKYQYPASSEEVTSKQFKQIKEFDREDSDIKKPSPIKFNAGNDRTKDQVDPYIANNYTSLKRRQAQDRYTKEGAEDASSDTMDKNETFNHSRLIQYQYSSEEIISRKHDNLGIEKNKESDIRSETVSDKNLRYPMENKTQYRKEDRKRADSVGHGRYAHTQVKQLYGSVSGELFLNQEKDFDEVSLVNDILKPTKNKSIAMDSNRSTKKKSRKHQFKKSRLIPENPVSYYDKLTRAGSYAENTKEKSDLYPTDETMSIYDKLRQAIMSKSYGRHKEGIEPPQGKEIMGSFSERPIQNQLETQEKQKHRNRSRRREPQTSSLSEELKFKESKRREKKSERSKDRHPADTKKQYDYRDDSKQYQSSSEEYLNRSEVNKKKGSPRDMKWQPTSDEKITKKRKKRKDSPGYNNDESIRDHVSPEDIISNDFEGLETGSRRNRPEQPREKQQYRSSSEETITRRGKYEETSSDYRRDRPYRQTSETKKQYRSSSEDINIKEPKVKKENDKYSRDRKKREESLDINTDITAQSRSPPEEAISKYVDGRESNGRPEKQELLKDMQHSQSSSEEIVTSHGRKQQEIPNEYKNEKKRGTSEYESRQYSRQRSQYQSSSEEIMSKEHSKKDPSYAKEIPLKDTLDTRRSPRSEYKDDKLGEDPSRPIRKKEEERDLQRDKLDNRPASERIRTHREKQQEQGVDYDKEKKPKPDPPRDKTQYISSSDDEISGQESKFNKKQRQKVYDKDKLGKKKAVGVSKETGTEEVEPERERLKPAAPNQGYDVSDKKWSNTLEEEELKLKLQRQREALFAKCRGFEPESTLKRDNTLSYKELMYDKIVKSSSEDESQDYSDNKPKTRSRTKERAKMRRTRSPDSSLSEITKFDSQLGALFSQSPGFTEKKLEQRKETSDVDAQSYTNKDRHKKSSYDYDEKKLPTYRSSSKKVFKEEEGQKDRSKTSEEVLIKRKIKEKSQDYSNEKGKKKRPEEYDQSSSEEREKSSKERAVTGRPESMDQNIYDQSPTHQHRPFSNEEITLKHKERSTSMTSEPLEQEPLPSFSNLADWHIDSSGSRIDVKSKGLEDNLEDKAKDQIIPGKETIRYDKDIEKAAQTKKHKPRQGEDDIEQEDERSERNKYKAPQKDPMREEDKLSRETALQKEKDKRDSQKRKSKKDKYSPDDSMGSVIEEDRHGSYDERHKYDKASQDKKYTPEDFKERKRDKKQNEGRSNEKEYLPGDTLELSQKEKYKIEAANDKKYDGKKYKEDNSVESKRIEEKDFQESRHTKVKMQPDEEDRTSKSGIDSEKQEPKKYHNDKKDGGTSRDLAEIAQNGGKEYHDTKLDDNKDFISLSDSAKPRSPDGLKDSIKSQDTENKKDADSKKDGAKLNDQKMATSLQLDKQMVDDARDSKKPQDFAKLQDAYKKGDPKRSKSYDDDESAQDSYDDKARKQSTAISDGTEDDYAKRVPSKDSPAPSGPLGTRSGKKLDVHGVPLEVFEELREQELRVINQRADSREEPDKEPPRMLSVPDAEKALALSTKEGQNRKEKSDTKVAPGKLGKRTSSTASHRPSQDIEEEKGSVGKRISSTGSRRPSQDIEEEKVLVVERIPLDKEKAKEYKERHKDTPLAVVKLEEFEALVKEVKELETRMRPASRFSFPGNAELLEHIRNGASLTEAMAALQLSARIEAAENALENIIEMVSKLAAQNPEVDIDKHGQPVIVKLPIGKAAKPVDYLGLDPMAAGLGGPQSAGGAKCREGCITKPEFDQEILKVQKQLAKEIGDSARKNLSKIDVLAKNLKTLESKVEDAVHMSNRISDLEDSVSSYSERINAMDTGLSVQMTSYQDQLTQMQHELEEGLENMAETLANAEGDPAAVAELHSKLNSLQDDLLNTSNVQSELEKNEHDVFVNLKDLFTQIEHLRETKADREEVEDALQNKAGLSALNGLISLEHFDALIGDMETHIGKAYDKFNNQELIWQKAINDLVKELNEKTNLEIVLNLRDDINNKLNTMTERISSLRDIVGEPRAFGVSKRINVGAECLSCKTPAQMEPEAHPTRMPAMKTSSPGGGSFMKEAGDACYPGYPIPHPLDPRSHICNRYCGGSHTVLKGVARAKSLPGAVTIKKWEKPITTAAGTDGKAYLVEDPNERGPCKPCNIVPSISAVKISPKPSVPVKGRAVFDIDIRECDKCPCFNVEPELESDVTLTG